MDAAEGTVDVVGVSVGGRLGLASWLFFRDLNPPARVTVCGVSCRIEGRIGDVF